MLYSARGRGLICCIDRQRCKFATWLNERKSGTTLYDCTDLHIPKACPHYEHGRIVRIGRIYTNKVDTPSSSILDTKRHPFLERLVQRLDILDIPARSDIGARCR